MSELPYRSPITYEPVGDQCRVTTPEGSTPPLELPQWDGQRVDWFAALDLPYMEDGDRLAALAHASGFSARGFDLILLDESPTRFRGAWCHQVRKITFRAGDHDRLTLSHTGLLIGSVGNIRLAAPGEVPAVDGWCLTAQAWLYESELASKAWFGILRRLFTAICAVTARTPEAELGTGELVEVALGDVGGCPNAVITKLWLAP